MHLSQSIDRARICILAIVLSWCTYASAETKHIIAAWVQYTADGVEARVVTREQCPEITDGKSVAMQERRAGPIEGHNNKVCIFEIPAATQSLKLDDQVMPCRLKIRLTV